METSKTVNVSTEVREGFKGGHVVVLTIGNQSFFLEERMVDEDDEMTSEEYANWYKEQLDIALNKITEVDGK
jgi:hypothetical protein